MSAAAWAASWAAALASAFASAASAAASLAALAASSERALAASACCWASVLLDWPISTARPAALSVCRNGVPSAIAVLPEAIAAPAASRAAEANSADAYAWPAARALSAVVLSAAIRVASAA